MRQQSVDTSLAADMDQDRDLPKHSAMPYDRRYSLNLVKNQNFLNSTNILTL